MIIIFYFFAWISGTDGIDGTSTGEFDGHTPREFNEFASKSKKSGFFVNQNELWTNVTGEPAKLPGNGGNYNNALRKVLFQINNQ